MTVNEAIRIMRARAPVVTCGAATIWHIGYIRYKCIEAVTFSVTEKGKYDITVTCRDGQALDSRTHLGLNDIELAPDCPEILRKMIYKDKTTVPLGENQDGGDIPLKEPEESAPSKPETAAETEPVQETAITSKKKEKERKKEDTPPEPVFISIILNDKSYYDVPISKVERWKELYPAVDVEQQLRNMAGWSEDNPQKRKTKSGILRFISRWLADEQNKGGSRIRTAAAPVDSGERSFDLEEFDRFTLGIS